MFFFRFHLRPKPSSKHAVESAGAYVNCWIDFKNHWGARQLAEIAIDDEGWLIRKLDEELETGREYYKGDEEDFKYVQEAEEVGWSFVYHTYGHDAPDNDEDEMDEHKAEPRAAPNGGPTKSVDDSNAPGGPPSVS